MLLKWRLKIRNFFKKYKRVIFIVAIVWLIIIAINYLLGHKKEEITLNTTYNPHEVLLTSETDVPEKLKTPIEDTIDDYVNKCNNKDYSGAFELLTADCKTHVFGDSLDNFTTYASSIFSNKKRYSIQNYSNYGQAYIYNIKLIDDIITTGLTNQSYAYYEEKMAIKEENGQIKLNVNDYMGYSELKRVAEDDYLKIRIESKEEFYSMEIYSIKITNKTDNKVVLYDGIVGNELSLISESDERTPINVKEAIILDPGETKTFEVTFNKYYDESTKASDIAFNKIRIMTNQYTGTEQTEEDELSKAEKTYSITVSLQ